MINFQTTKQQLSLAGYEEIRSGIFHRTLSDRKRFHIYQISQSMYEIHFDKDIHRKGCERHLSEEVKRIRGCKDSIDEFLRQRNVKKLEFKKQWARIFDTKRQFKRDRALFPFIQKNWWHKYII